MGILYAHFWAKAFGSGELINPIHQLLEYVYCRKILVLIGSLNLGNIVSAIKF